MLGRKAGWGKRAGKKYGKYIICDERFYSYWVPGLVELIFPDWFLSGAGGAGSDICGFVGRPEAR